MYLKGKMFIDIQTERWDFCYAINLSPVSNS